MALKRRLLIGLWAVVVVVVTSNGPTALTADLLPLILADSGRMPENMAYVRVSKRFLAGLIDRDILHHATVSDTILGTALVSDSQTAARLEFRLLPNARTAVGELHFWGNESHESIGNAGPVQMTFRGTGRFDSVKTVWLDERGFHFAPARTVAHSESIMTGLQTSLPGLRGRIVRRIASARHEQQQALAQEIVSEHLRDRVSQYFDATVDNQLSQIWDAVNTRLTALRSNGTLHAEGLFARSSPEALELVILGSPGDGSGYVAGPSTRLGNADLVVDIHASVVKAAMSDPEINRLLGVAIATEVSSRANGSPLSSFGWTDDGKWLSLGLKPDAELAHALLTVPASEGAIGPEHRIVESRNTSRR